jgi:hypothetical protein
MNDSRADILALIVMILIATAMILWGDWRFGASVLIASVLVFIYARRRTRRKDRYY